MNSDPLTNTAEAFITADDIGAAMKTLRGEETQKDCAKRGGLDRASWNQYEKGKSYPKADNIERIAQGLGVQVAELTEAVIQSWARRMGRHPYIEQTEPELYNFSVSGQLEIRQAGRPKEI